MKIRGIAVAALLAVATVAAPSAAETDPTVPGMLADVAALSQAPREAGTPGEQAAVDHVVADLRGLGVEPTVTAVPLVNGRTSHNVSTSFGSGFVEVLLGAHIDSVPGSPGADDNASGVAVLLELARRLDLGILRIPEGTTVTLVWFGAEERLAGFGPNVHHAGSRQLAAARLAAGAMPHWMLSVDMVGYGPRALAVHLDGTTAEAAGMLDACAGETGPEAVVARGDISDHEAFANFGTPSALLWRPDNPDYHGPGDTEVVDANLFASMSSASLFISCATGIGSSRSVVHHLQADLLARRPDVGGAGFFAGRIGRGDTPGDVGRALLTSPEWGSVLAPVARVYLAAFGRHADHGGLVHWSGLRRAGAPLESIAAAFTASPEFAARNGAPDDRGFVRLLYRNVLGRDADQAGEDYWVGELASGRMSRAGVLVSFSESPEHRVGTAAALPVALAYAGLLRRAVDPEGLAYWQTRPLEELVDGLVGSAEFRARFA